MKKIIITVVLTSLVFVAGFSVGQESNFDESFWNTYPITYYEYISLKLDIIQNDYNIRNNDSAIMPSMMNFISFYPKEDSIMFTFDIIFLEKPNTDILKLAKNILDNEFKDFARLEGLYSKRGKFKESVYIIGELRYRANLFARYINGKIIFE